MFRINQQLVLFCTFVSALSMLSTADATGFSIEREDSGDIAIHIDGELFTRYATTATSRVGN